MDRFGHVHRWVDSTLTRPTHTAYVVRDALAKMQIVVMEWPPFHKFAVPSPVVNVFARDLHIKGTWVELVDKISN